MPLGFLFRRLYHCFFAHILEPKEYKFTKLTTTSKDITLTNAVRDAAFLDKQYSLWFSEKFTAKINIYR